MWGLLKSGRNDAKPYPNSDVDAYTDSVAHSNTDSNSNTNTNCHAYSHAPATPTTTPAATPTATPGQLGNISTRLKVETGDNVLIGGIHCYWHGAQAGDYARDWTIITGPGQTG